MFAADWDPVLQFLLVALAVALLTLLLTGAPERGLPPGPRGLPVFGSLPWVLRRGPLRAFRELAARHGPVWSMRMGSRRMVVLSDYEAVKEALVRHADVFSDRDRPYIVEKITQGALGIAHSNFPLLRDIRKFSLSALRGFGVGKKSLERRVHEEIGMYCAEVATAAAAANREEPGRGVDLRQLTMSAVSNIICGIVFGDRYEYSDPQFLSLLHMMNENFSVSQTGAAFIFVPLIRYLPLLNRSMSHLQANLARIKGFVVDRIREHRDNFDPENLRDIIDMYIKAQQDAGATLSDVNDITHYASEPQMIKVILDLFFAGTETTSTTLLWGFLFMSRHAEVQERCRREIQAVYGESGGTPPSVEDRDKLVYTDATLMEIQRLGDIAPFAIMHYSRKRCQLSGYDIPKDAFVVPHLNALHRDPKYWSKPNEFNPDRFIDSDGKLIAKPDSYLPFSIGRRVCLGEALAKMELFDFFAAVLQRFRLELPEGETEQWADMEGHLGLTRSPLPYRVLVSPL